MAQKKTNAIELKSYSIDKINDMTSLATALKDHVVRQNLYTNIHGKNYVHVEGWQFAGKMLGLSPLIKSVQNVSTEKARSWLAHVEIVDVNNVVRSNGYALCSSAESKKSSFDEYALLSMAQTRAIGKGYRNLIGWVMKLAGYEGTPMEEVRKANGDVNTTIHTEVVSEPVVNMADGTVVGPDGEKGSTCKKCDAFISKKVASYSKKVFNKELCFDCQKEVKGKK